MDYAKLQNILNEYQNVPYPEIKKIYPNHAYANLLYDDFAGDSGELTAITQYIYEHIYLKEEGELSNILLGIAIQEMKHLELVGNFIKVLGNKPYYISSKGNYWNSTKVNYQYASLPELMKYNVKTEEIAIAGYRRAIQNTRSLEIRKLFDRIIKDEKNHIKIFNEILKDIESKKDQ